jgi:hypothetical protein
MVNGSGVTEGKGLKRGQIQRHTGHSPISFSVVPSVDSFDVLLRFLSSGDLVSRVGTRLREHLMQNDVSKCSKAITSSTT